ncbi:MAG: RNA polymerase sigma factor [Planctomycetota bacterium]
MSGISPPPQPLGDLSDEGLVTAYLDGRVEAFEELVGRYQDGLFRFLLRFVGSRASADDLFQETFLQVHQSAGTFDTRKRFKPWIFTIAANKARDHLRRNQRRSAASLSAPVRGAGDEGGVSFVDLIEDPLPMPEDRTQVRETADLVREVVGSLPDHLREVLLLAYFEQFAYKEIAEMLGIPLGTVKSRLHAAVGGFADRWRAKYGSTPPTEMG